jgi:hypothetical protein
MLKKIKKKKYELSETLTSDASDVGQAACLLDKKEFAAKYRAKTVFILRWYDGEAVLYMVCLSVLPLSRPSDGRG